MIVAPKTCRSGTGYASNARALPSNSRHRISFSSCPGDKQRVIVVGTAADEPKPQLTRACTERQDSGREGPNAPLAVTHDRESNLRSPIIGDPIVAGSTANSLARSKNLDTLAIIVR